MDKPIIKSITSINQQGTKKFTINSDNVFKIVDNSMEFPDSIYVQYDIYAENGKLLHAFINGAFYIEYI